MKLKKGENSCQLLCKNFSQLVKVLQIVFHYEKAVEKFIRDVFGATTDKKEQEDNSNIGNFPRCGKTTCCALHLTPMNWKWWNSCLNEILCCKETKKRLIDFEEDAIISSFWNQYKIYKISSLEGGNSHFYWNLRQCGQCLLTFSIKIFIPTLKKGFIIIMLEKTLHNVTNKTFIY